MKVYVDFKDNGTGKAKFVWRLIPALEKIGVKCSLSPEGCDIALAIAWQNNPAKGMPYILRLDGLSFDKGRKCVEKTSRKINESIANSKAIIWQSEFCHRILSQVLSGVAPKKQFKIFNGADPADYEHLPVVACQYPRRIIMSAHWYKKGHERTNKRLREMLEIVAEHCANRDDTCAWVAGESNLKPTGGKTVMLGHLPENLLRCYLASSTVMLYLAHYDWCPNSVVESLVAGTPVICPDGSGVAEIVGKNGGVILPVFGEVGIREIYAEPQPINKTMVLEALNTINPYRVIKPELYIDNIAMQYKSAFEEVLK